MKFEFVMDDSNKSRICDFSQSSVENVLLSIVIEFEEVTGMVKKVWHCWTHLQTLLIIKSNDWEFFYTMYPTGVAASRGVRIVACSSGEGRGHSSSWWCEGLTSVGNFPKPYRKQPGLWYSDTGRARRTCPSCVLNSEFEGFEACKRGHSSTEENAFDRGWETEERPRWHEEANHSGGAKLNLKRTR
jgi:hypothetical protein